MSIPWWKTAPTPNPDAKAEVEPEPAPSGPSRPWSEGTPGVQQVPPGFDATSLRCSAFGCTFQGAEFATAALGPGVRPYCQHHATGGELKVADLLWRLPCACGKVADGFSQLVGGYSATHTATKCIERTVQASPDDLTVPMGSLAAPLEGAQVVRDQKCACGKRMDGARASAIGFIEMHLARECIEQTTRGA